MLQKNAIFKDEELRGGNLMKRRERHLWIGLAILSFFLAAFSVDSVSASGEWIDLDTLAGAGLPRITVAPLSLDFGPVKMDATSPEETITVTNGGVGDLVITGIGITGSQASEFHQTNDCTTIPADGSCTIRAVFAPTFPFGEKSAKVSISSNDPAKPLLNVVMTGKSPRPKISVSPVPPAVLNLGPAGVGKTSLPKAITVRNNGISDLLITGITIKGLNGSEFGQTTDCTTVLTGGSCTITVTFSPILPFGQKSGKVSISSNDPGKPVVYVPVTGKAPPPKISVSPVPPAILNFGPVGVGKTSLPKAITVQNKGVSDLVISGITITGPNGSEFGQTTDCDTVPAGGSCTVNVTLTPSPPFGPKEATVRISSNDPVTPTIRVKVTGKAPPPKISVTPAPLETLEFGSVGVGSTSLPATVTVSNIGLSDLVVSGISLTGPNGSEFNQTNDCSTVPAETSCTINATFSPASTGIKNASMNISSNDPAKPAVTLKLKGEGQPGTGAGVWDTSTWDNGIWGP
jgi:hypothetical protein